MAHPGTPAKGVATVPPAAVPLLTKLGRMRDECIALLGPVGETVVNKHYQKARAEIERGAGAEALEEAVSQIARAASILKGPSVSDAILERSAGSSRPHRLDQGTGSAPAPRPSDSARAT